MPNVAFSILCVNFAARRLLASRSFSEVDIFGYWSKTQYFILYSEQFVFFICLYLWWLFIIERIAYYWKNLITIMQKIMMSAMI